MEIKILVAILTMGASICVYAKNIDFCKTIEFDTGDFNYSAIEKASSDSQCRFKPVPLQYRGIKDTFNLKSEAHPTGGASYLIWDESKKIYGYDKTELKNTVNDIIKRRANWKYIEALSYEVKITFIPKRNGGVVVSDIVFEDNKNKPISFIRDIYFYSLDNYSAIYGSGLIKYSQKNEVDFADRARGLFESMAINWWCG